MLLTRRLVHGGATTNAAGAGRQPPPDFRGRGCRNVTTPVPLIGMAPALNRPPCPCASPHCLGGAGRGGGGAVGREGARGGVWRGRCVVVGSLCWLAAVARPLVG